MIWRSLSKKPSIVAPLMLTLAFCVATTASGPVVAQATAPAKEKAKATAKAKTATTTPLDLNKATAEKMKETLPGVGEVIARKIVAGRPYTSIDDLAKAGVSARTIEQIRPLVTVSAPAEPVVEKEKAKAKAVAKAKAKEAPVAPAGKVDLNHATAEQLETLPGIGSAHARDIIAARPFQSVDDLERVKGLTKARIDALRDHVTLGTPVVASPAPVSPAPTTKTATKPAASKAATKPVVGRIVNLNTATKDELVALPGIGPVKAQAILDYRQAQPFKSKEDVMKVKGIKEGEFAKIKDLIVAP